MSLLVSMIVCAALLIANAPALRAQQQIRPGVWEASQLDALPVPTSYYQAYLVGEIHGLQQNAEFQVSYLELLSRTSNLRDLAIEEKSVYEKQAQAYIDGNSHTSPASLCLRASLLRRIRQLNATLAQDRKIRIHLADIDSPAAAIRDHLLSIQSRMPKAHAIRIPEVNQVKEHGLATVAALKELNTDANLTAELRTVAYSIQAYLDGFEAGTGPASGSPYLEEREQAVTDNIAEIASGRPVMVIYGDDHISKSERNDGGPERNQPFRPLAERLEQSGVKTFSIVTFPLAGRSSWRGNSSDLLWTASDGHLYNGETLDKVLTAAPQAKFLYVDPLREHVRLPSQDISNYKVDGFVLFPSAQPLVDECK